MKAVATPSSASSAAKESSVERRGDSHGRSCRSRRRARAGRLISPGTRTAPARSAARSCRCGPSCSSGCRASRVAAHATRDRSARRRHARHPRRAAADRRIGRVAAHDRVRPHDARRSSRIHGVHHRHRERFPAPPPICSPPRSIRTSAGGGSSPAATEIELHLGRWFAQRLGLAGERRRLRHVGRGDGGIRRAQSRARQRVPAGPCASSGVRAGPPLTCYASDQVHDVNTRAADMLGIGRDAVRIDSVRRPTVACAPTRCAPRSSATCGTATSRSR